MNDLAEMALHGLDVARRRVAAHPMSTYAATGLAVSCVVVLAGGRVAAQAPNHPLVTWLGLENTHGLRIGEWVPGAVLLAALLLLLALWLGVVGFVRRRDQYESRVWWVATAWAAPFVLGPPLMGTSVQSYVAFGLMQRQGLDPYLAGPARLGDSAIAAAVDPAARVTPSAAGPLGSLVQHLAVSVSAGSALGALLLLRLLGVVCAVVIGRVAADLGGLFRARALTLAVLNPLVLLYVVSAARLDGLMIALVLLAVRAANQRRWLLAVVLACLSGSVLGQGFVVLPALLALHLVSRRGAPAWLVLGRDVLVAAATITAAGFTVHDGFGWVRTVSKQFGGHTPYSVTSAVATALAPVVRAASYDDLAAGARITAITAMVAVLAYLTVTVRQRALERTVAYALLALALLAPLLYPWYLLWGTVCLAPTANGSRRVAVLALSAAGCLLSPAGFSPLTTNVLTAALLAVIAAIAFGRPGVRRGGGRRGGGRGAAGGDGPAAPVSAGRRPAARRARARS